MKKQKESKLKLNKVAIANLNTEELVNVRGGSNTNNHSNQCTPGGGGPDGRDRLGTGIEI